MVPSPAPARPPQDQVPVRSILASVGIVLGSVAGLWMLWSVKRILGWMVIAVFFAVILGPAVDFLVHKAKLRRSLATLLVFLTGLGLLAAMLYAFIRPIVDQATTFSDHLPGYVADAKAGKGPVGHLVKKYKLDDYVEKNQKKLKSTLSDIGVDPHLKAPTEFLPDQDKPLGIAAALERFGVPRAGADGGTAGSIGEPPAEEDERGHARDKADHQVAEHVARDGACAIGRHSTHARRRWW
jgi:hypothetical protein